MFAPDLLANWREKATGLEQFGATEQAITLRKCADDLDDTWDQWVNQPLTLQQAAESGGYSTAQLGRLVREGTIPNAGRRNAPRIFRKDVPIKPGHASVAPSRAKVDSMNMQIVQSIIEGVQR